MFDSYLQPPVLETEVFFILPDGPKTANHFKSLYMTSEKGVTCIKMFSLLLKVIRVLNVVILKYFCTLYFRQISGLTMNYF